ncbi:putative thiamine pyrophosphokinase [Aspergillus affinis]|uniref:putative thiamine pyrophosphokinase n=1 Tax=Aspergillus affinis TaxID=1070780 RepID=UPI0022FF4591|nr:putative thiamine pyrophosphokinase [Aspergillus affinis]KAI9042951.1 putative thiamine pyrophosphokinase [Aspergillus affinis]
MGKWLDVVQGCDNFPYAEDQDSELKQQYSYDSLWKFYLPEDPRPHGLMVESVVSKMPWTSDFRVISTADKKEVHLLRPQGEQNWQDQCSKIIERQIAVARESGALPGLGRPRHEEFPIVGAQFSVGIDRSAFSMFGIIGRGVHMTVYTQTDSGIKFWVPQRNASKSTYPGCLDNTVAGGMATGEEPLECLLREATEEAGMSEDSLRRDVRAAGTVTWINISDERSGGQPGLINPGVLYVYDLEVKPDVVFQPVDNDIEAFHLMDAEKVKQALLGGRFKPASGCVILDFLIRHGVITPEEEEDYAEIVSRLHRKLPLPSRSYS